MVFRDCLRLEKRRSSLCRFHSLSISASPMFFAGKSAYDGLEELHVWKIWERKAGAWKRGKYEGRKRKEEVEIEGGEACV